MDNGSAEISQEREKNGSDLEKIPVKTVSIEVDRTKESIAPTISFHDIQYKVNTNEGCCSRCKPKTKKILHSVSGIMKPGLNAIMGPTGSGKSTLLDILANRKDPAGLTGDVLVNGAYLPSNFKHFSGYVVQQDILIGTLSVRENLWYSANLRMPRSVGKEEKRKRVEEVLFDLGLTGCANTRIGNEMMRGVSGGEKKRASIAMELITSPSVLFLDEPTTGLDASTANAVIVLLKRLSKKGRTVVLSIHQPRFSIFRLFDTLTLLSQGHIVYHGPYDNALPHFEALGYRCEEHNNPADFFLDVINGDSTALATSLDDDAEIVDKKDETSASRIACDLEAKFNSSQVCSNLNEELSRIDDATKKEKKQRRSSLVNQHGYATPIYYQFLILLRRSFISMIRNPMAAIGNFVISMLIGILFGIFYYQVDKDPVTGPQNRFGILFFMTTNVLFTSINAIEVFVRERVTFKHEYVSGYYAVAPYFLSSLVADLLPIRTIAPIIFATITYWMVGLKATAGAFFTFLLYILLTGYAAVSIALFFSSTFSTYAVANIFTTLVYVFSIMFGGLLLNVDTVMSWIGWVRYLSIANYGYSGLSVNEFRGQVYSGCSTDPTALSLGLGQISNNTLNVGGNLTTEHCVTVTGEEIISKQLGIGTDGLVQDWDLWKNSVALSCITVGMLTLTYIQLSRTKVTT